MKLTCLTLFLSITLPGFTQVVEKFYDFNWAITDAAHARFYGIIEHSDSGYHERDYFLHNMELQMDGWFEDSACKIRSGKFTYAYPGKRLESTGRYLHNRRWGLWISIHPNGMMADSTFYDDNGNPVGTTMAWHSNGINSDSSVYNPDGSGVRVTWFDNGSPSSAGRLSAGYKKVGRWQFSHKNGHLSAIELYDNDKLLQRQYYDENGQAIADTTTRDRDASFPGGIKAWLKYLDKHLYFPPDYQITNSDEAAVVITMTVDEDGKIKDAYISTPFYQPFEKIALDVINKSPLWQPAIDHNRRVSHVFVQPVIFKQLED